jgi:hypothetical protein
MANRPRTTRSSRGSASAAGSSGSGPQSLHFSAVNLALGVAGLVSLVLGYWLLAGGSITAAPLLLVLGYVVLLPLALIL